MRNRIRFFRARDFDHTFRDQWPRDTRPEKILAFVERAGLKHRENKIACEFLLKILDDTFRSASLQRLLLKSGELFFLTNVRAESDDLRLIIFFEPAKDDRRVESAGICQDNLHKALIVDG